MRSRYAEKTAVIDNTVLATGVWHHIAAVWDGTYMRLYVNGVLDATLANGNGPASGTSSLKLGRNSGGNYYNGLIDEVRISNTAVYTSNFTPQTHLSATANTKALWKFNGQVVTDASTNGNNGTLQGGATYSTDVPSGSVSHSLSVDGATGHVQVANSSSLNITGAITVEAWIKPNSIGAYQYIVSRENYGVAGSGGGYELSLNNVGKARFDLFHSPTTYTPVIGNTTLTAGVWYHVAGVWDGSQMRVYLNGVLDGSLGTGNGPASGTNSLKLGRNSGGSYFNGLIDEVRVSSSAVYSGSFTPELQLTVGANTRGLWKFTNQNVLDSSSNSNNGTSQGWTGFSTDVPTGPAYHSLSLNGTSGYVQIPNSTSLNITGAITVEAWVKPNFIGAYQYIASRETYGVSGSGGGYELSLNNLGKARFDLFYSHNTYTPVIGNTVLTTGVWHHIAAVWDGAFMRLYVNGVLDATLANGNGPASGTSSLKLGRNSGGNYYNGLIDEVRISNTAVYTSNFTPQTHLSATANTKGLWKFDGQVVTDASTNGNNGTLQSGATYSDDVPSGDGGGGSGGGSSSGGGASKVQWLVSDHLGTPRMIFDVTGRLDKMTRHDYLPFGEELFAPAGGRSSAMGYAGGDGVRQQFTSKERDIESGMDYFETRYYPSTSGRFASPDDFTNDTHPADPQTWNLYAYARNNPLRFVDPDGRIKKDANGKVIFEKQSDTTFLFIEDREVLGTDGQVLKDESGRPLKATVQWKAEKGVVFADDGTRIEAFRATGEIEAIVKDGDGNINDDKSADLKATLMNNNSDNKTDCHGTTFAQGEVWINDNQVEKIIRGDGYTRTSRPQQGDVGIYTRDGNLRNTVHSVLVNSVTDRQVGNVISKGGITPRVTIAPGPGPNTAWQDQTVRLRYFTKRTGGSRR